MAEPVAVVGIGCRLPGGVRAPEDLWQLLRSGRAVRAEVPRERWAAYEAAGPDFAAVLDETTRWGAFLEDVAGFDAAFFGISPREAAVMDPQQRILLEVAWEALERAGLPPSRLADGTGVFVGVWSDDYGRRLLEDLPGIVAWTGVGGSMGSVAGRLSHALDLRGPSLAVDTACSSSLLAVHLACQSLRAGECRVALAGGVNLLLSPGLTVALQRAGAVTEDGRSKVFDASADGYARSEGCVVLVLERLSDALRDGDPVLAVVRGSAVTQNGRAGGIMAPSAAAQVAAMREACASAGVAPESVGYVEAHGTGTELGDRVEAAAIGEVYGAGLVGSVKANLGHLESASGVVGVLKAILALRHGEIPPTPAPEVLIPGVRLVTEPTPWAQRPRRAGVSSYGFGGTNAHLVLEEAPSPALRAVLPREGGGASSSFLVPVSGASAEGLRANVGRLLEWVRGREVCVRDVACTLGRRRAHLGHRMTVVARDREELERGLETWVGDGRGIEGGLVWVFSGQGSQWTGMGRELMEAEPVFRAVLDELEGVYAEELGVSLRGLACEEELEGAGADVVQPLIHAMQVGLAEVLGGYGVRPAAVIGHSMGEISAAVVAGALSREEGARLICRRSVLLRRVVGRGGMALVGLGAAELERRLAGSGLEVAVSGSGASAVVSGGVAELAAAMAAWQREGLEVRRVASDVAFHSEQMDALMDELAGAMELHPRELGVGFYSTVLADARERPALDGRYWAENLRRRVRFGEAVRAAVADGGRVFQELSPHPVVARTIEEVLGESGVEGRVAWTLRRGQPAVASLLGQVGELHCAGVAVSWERLAPEGELLDLPTTAWQHRRHWLDAAAGPTRSLRAPAPAESLAMAIGWHPVAPPAPAPVPSAVVLVGDDGPLARELAAALGDRCVRIARPDALVGRLGPGTAVVMLPPAGVWAVASAARRLAAREGARLWCLTAGVRESATRTALAQAPLWGLCTVIAGEHPEIWGGLVDLDPGEPPAAAAALLLPLLGGTLDDGVRAARGGALLARRTEPLDGVPDEPPVSLRPDGTYLVTGGLGALGLEVARWLAGRGARRLVLTSRRGLGPRSRWDPGVRAVAAVRDLERAGVTVRTLAVDVADAERMAALLDPDALGLPPVRGVVHAAGIAEGSLLRDLDEASLRRVLRPKVEGALVLDELFPPGSLDFLVLFSSVAALIGAAGQASYAAANAFLDALAAHRRELGCPARSLAWSLWRDLGVTTSAGRMDDEYRALGVGDLTPDEAFAAWERAERTDVAHVVVARLHAAARRPSVFGAGDAPAEPGPWLALDSGELHDRLLAEVRRQVAAELRLAPGELDVGRPLADLGLESVMALGVRRRLEAATGVPLPATLVWSHPTVAALAAHLGERLGPAVAPAGDERELLEQILAAAESAAPQEAKTT